jgi:hypothetical protein
VVSPVVLSSTELVFAPEYAKASKFCLLSSGFIIKISAPKRIKQINSIFASVAQLKYAYVYTEENYGTNRISDVFARTSTISLN